MSESLLTKRLADLVLPLAASLELEIWGIELSFGARSLARIFVERPLEQPDMVTVSAEGALSCGQAQGVTIEQCAELSRLLSLTLDVEDLMPGAYVLEVSSPGLERVFFTEEQLARAVGQTVDITLHEPIAEFPGRRKFRGILQSVPHDSSEESRDFFRLGLDETVPPGEKAAFLHFTFSEVKKARQVHVPLEKSKPGKGAKNKSEQKK